MLNCNKSRYYRVLIFFIVNTLLANRAQANIAAIDFAKIASSAAVQTDLDFLKGNTELYDHYSHDWNATVPKAEVIAHLTAVYNDLINQKNINEETYLLLGDLAHYLYNLDAEGYYQKAIGNYNFAVALAPDDYRAYWFLGRHYSLSAQQVLSIQNFRIAFGNLPKVNVNARFWMEYAEACSLASMPITAKYAAHHASEVSGSRTYIEATLSSIIKRTLKSTPVDTTLTDRETWSATIQSDNSVVFNNWIMDFKVRADGDWKIQTGGFSKGGSYIVISPSAERAPSGQKITYSMLILSKIKQPGQSLSDFLDEFTLKGGTRKSITFDVGSIKNCMAYEIFDPSAYKSMGGGHMYAIALERDAPVYPDMALEEAQDLPKNNTSALKVYSPTTQLRRVNTGLYYLIMLDSCEFINKQSLAAFKDLLQNRLLIE